MAQQRKCPQNNKNKKTTLPTGPLGEVGCRDGYGPMWAAVSNTPYRQYKIETFDGGLSAPFIIRYPSKIRPGSRYHSPFLLQDIAPTCLAWAALPIPAHMDGKPLNTYWNNPPKLPPSKVWDFIPNTCPPRTIFWEHQRNQAALTSQFKLVAPNRGPWQVYDIRDRTEQKNLASRHQTLVEQLSAQYRKGGGKPCRMTRHGRKTGIRALNVSMGIPFRKKILISVSSSNRKRHVIHRERKSRE